MIFSTENSRTKTTSTSFTLTLLREKTKRISKKRAKNGVSHNLQLETAFMAQKTQRQTKISRSINSNSNSRILRQTKTRMTPLVARRSMGRMPALVASELLTTTTSGAKTPFLEMHFRITIGTSTRSGCVASQKTAEIISLTGTHSSKRGTARKLMQKDELNERLSMGHIRQRTTPASMIKTELIRRRRRAVAGRPLLKAKACLK